MREVLGATLGVTAPIALGLGLISGILYAGIHFVEGNIITPLVQAEAVELGAPS